MSKAILLAILFCIIGYAAQARDVRVVDGDTIVTNTGEHVRLSGIDAPSTIKKGPQAARCDNEMQVGLKAKDRVSQLLAGQDYRLVYDKAHGKKRVDKYGRTLAHVRVGGTDIGNTLVSENLAVSWNGTGPHPNAWCGAQAQKR